MHCSITIICGRLTCYHCALFKCIFPSINYSRQAAPHWGTHLSARRVALWGPWFTQLQFCASFGPKPWWTWTLVPAGAIKKKSEECGVLLCKGKKTMHQWMWFQVLKNKSKTVPPILISAVSSLHIKSTDEWKPIAKCNGLECRIVKCRWTYNMLHLISFTTISQSYSPSPSPLPMKL